MVKARTSGEVCTRGRFCGGRRVQSQFHKAASLWFVSRLIGLCRTLPGTELLVVSFAKLSLQPLSFCQLSDFAKEFLSERSNLAPISMIFLLPKDGGGVSQCNPHFWALGGMYVVVYSTKTMAALHEMILFMRFWCKYECWCGRRAESR